MPTYRDLLDLLVNTSSHRQPKALVVIILVEHDDGDVAVVRLVQGLVGLLDQLLELARRQQDGGVGALGEGALQEPSLEAGLGVIWRQQQWKKTDGLLVCGDTFLFSVCFLFCFCQLNTN